MSQSGVPIVSDVAKVAVNTANAVSSIASGGNVFENLGRIAIQPATFAAGKLHTTTFGVADKVPVLGDVSRLGYELSNDPRNKQKALQFGIATAKAAAVAGGAAVGGPLIAGQLGIGSGAGALLGGGIAQKLSNGDISGAANLASGAATGYLAGTDIGQAFSPYASDIKNLINSAPKSSANTPINNITPANQIVNKSVGFSGPTILIAAGTIFVAFYYMKKRRVF